MLDDEDSGTSETGAFGALLREVAKPPAHSDAPAPDLIGATLHQYQVTALLGHGGMGVVYRAQDTRLGRQVALKVIPRALSHDEERRRRFLREARSAAAIAHPNIATIFEVDEAEGRVFLVMELIDGETLRETLRAGALPIPEAVRIGKAIARGLSKAHEKGIVHRDLKPENVMITREGDVKILDFGLAKLSSEANNRTELENQPTDVAVTEVGVVLGTLAYMSPEQASGAPLDARSDLFSFGVVLFELVTGRAPFAGATRRDVLAALLRDAPVAPSRYNPSAGPDLERAILRCLRKKPEDRFASADEVLAALEGKAEIPRQGRARLPAALVAAGGITVAGAALLLGVGRTTPVAKPTPSIASAIPSPAPHVARMVDLPAPATQLPTAAAAFMSAMQALHDDNWFKALGLFAEAAKLDPTMAAAHLYLSLASVVMNDPSTRRAEYEKATGLRSQLGERDRALLEALQPFLQSAIQDIAEVDRRLRALAERYPGDEEIWMLIGLVHYGTAAALAPAEKALTLDPTDAQSWENKGHGSLAVGRFADARAAFERCGSLSVDGADCFAWTGITYSLEGKCADYEREMRRAADRNPFWSFALLWAIASTGHSKTALQETEKQALSALPSPMDAQYEGAGVDVRLAILEGDFTAASALVKRESAMVAADPGRGASYPPHYDLTSQRLEIALETGDDAATRQLVGDFLAHRDAWPFEAMFGHGVDLSLYAARLLAASGQPPSDFEAQRKTWIDKALFAGADRAQIWDYGYASPALTAREAEAALDALPSWGPPSPTPPNFDDLFGRMGSPEADIGRVYLLAGKVDLAIDHLQRAVATCDLYTSTLDHLRAALNLGRALEENGDVAGACDAYGKVLQQWGRAKPRSVTGDAARARWKALGCGSGH